ncbi:OVARIAN TUMOR DOMAIN-containing deubiquitinating enzyme 4 [Linum grandiflorum]
MLGVLRPGPKPWIVTSLANHFHGHSPAYYTRQLESSRFKSSQDDSFAVVLGGVVSNSCRLVDCIWHIQCSACSSSFVVPPRGEGSWNVAWDGRPARWLARPGSSWLLFGACHAPIEFWLANAADDLAAAAADQVGVGGNDDDIDSASPPASPEVKDEIERPADYKVTGVLADGRCLFRAIAHGDCLRKGKEAPDEDCQRQLADELRAQVAEELVKRREEVGCFIEDDFDTYVDRMKKPYVWGGEPELLMASHILKTMISVYMKDRVSDDLVSIASYGEEYGKDGENPINVLFHGYGHYDLLEGLNNSYKKKANV